MIAWPPAELLTDEYQLAMADSYLAQGIADEPVAFELFVRTLPRAARASWSRPGSSASAST